MADLLQEAGVSPAPPTTGPTAPTSHLRHLCCTFGLSVAPGPQPGRCSPATPDGHAWFPRLTPAHTRREMARARTWPFLRLPDKRGGFMDRRVTVCHPSSFLTRLLCRQSPSGGLSPPHLPASPLEGVDVVPRPPARWPLWRQQLLLAWAGRAAPWPSVPHDPKGKGDRVIYCPDVAS